MANISITWSAAAAAASAQWRIALCLLRLFCHPANLCHAIFAQFALSWSFQLLWLLIPANYYRPCMCVCIAGRTKQWRIRWNTSQGNAHTHTHNTSNQQIHSWRERVRVAKSVKCLYVMSTNSWIFYFFLLLHFPFAHTATACVSFPFDYTKLHCPTS